MLRTHSIIRYAGFSLTVSLTVYALTAAANIDAYVYKGLLAVICITLTTLNRCLDGAAPDPTT